MLLAGALGALIGIILEKRAFNHGYCENCHEQLGLFDYDGRQYTQGHDFGAWSHEEPFEIIQERDQIKNNFCQKHNLTLVRIPYTNKKLLWKI